MNETTRNETIRIRPWIDPVIDTLGHDPRSIYFETYYLPALGPSTVLLMRRLAAWMEQHPDGCELSLAETSQSLGLGAREGRSSPLWRSFQRLVQFDLAHEDDHGFAVRRLVPPVNRRHVRRLPLHLQASHDDWVRVRLAEPPMEAARRNARRMALTLIQMGEDLDLTERTLCTAGFHPALCRESAAWAWNEHRADLADLLADGGPAAMAHVDEAAS